jgi:hypothetical protein
MLARVFKEKAVTLSTADLILSNMHENYAIAYIAWRTSFKRRLGYKLFFIKLKSIFLSPSLRVLIVSARKCLLKASFAAELSRISNPTIRSACK